MASITLTSGSTSRSIELLDEVNDADAVNVHIGSKYAELTTDSSLAGDTPRLKFSKNGTDYWIREVFGPIDYLAFVAKGLTVKAPIRNNANGIIATNYYTIDWGDGTIENFDSTNPPSHTYAVNEERTIRLTQQEGYSNRGWLSSLTWYNNKPSTLRRITAWPDDTLCLCGDVTTVGDNFAENMFKDCVNLTSLHSNFNFPQNLTEVGDCFAHNMFYNCDKLSSLPVGFNFPQNLTEVGDYFAYFMFALCNTLSDIQDLRATWVQDSCARSIYKSMFYITAVVYDESYGFPQCAWRA